MIQPAKTMAVAPGTLVGPYEIVAAIGAGGMGEVYRASDPRLRREVAVKVLHAGVSADPSRLKRFEQEALAAASLNHPNILAVYDVGLHDGSPYIVSELLLGQSLRERIGASNQPAMTVRKALEYAVQIAYGLAAAHEKGIIHRDLKPDNLFITKDDRIKILDFGLAKLMVEPIEAGGSLLTAAGDTQPGMILGTVGYMAPEQVRGEAADQRTDIFAFAAVLYEMVTGQRAFMSSSSVATMHAILEQDPDFSRQERRVPAALERTIRRCLEKDADQRFQSAKDLAFNLEALSSDSGASIIAPAPAGSPARSRLMRRVVVGAVVAGAAAGGLLAGRMLGGEPHPTFTRLTFRRGTVVAARFAPDGQTIVYDAAWQGSPSELFSSRVDSPESRSLGAPGASILGISPTGEMALSMPNGTLARAPLAGGDPHESIDQVVTAAWAADGRLAVVRVVGGRRHVEFPAGTKLYETAANISAIAISRDSQSVACVEAPPGIASFASIALIDASGAHRILTDGWREIAGIAWSPGGGEVWFTASKRGVGAGTLFGITPGGRLREIMRVPARLQLHDVRPDGRVLLARTDRRFEARGLMAGDTAERDLSWFDNTGLSDISPDGKTLILTEAGEPIAIYVRRAGTASAARVAEGGAFALSPDGSSLIVQNTVTPAQIGILPIGPGEARVIPHPGFVAFSWANWFPDGKRILVAASETGHRPRLYVEDLDGGGRRAIAPEGVSIRTGSTAISPDGKMVAALERGRTGLYPVDGGAPRPVPGLANGDLPIRWTDDGRALYVFRQGELPARVYRVNVETGEKDLWRQIGPSDTAGVTSLGHILLTQNGAAYAYNYLRTLSDLYLVEGLK
jgi:hypothetical protein